MALIEKRDGDEEGSKGVVMHECISVCMIIAMSTMIINNL